jgi:predicted N-acetyltransferase YhbS
MAFSVRPLGVKDLDSADEIVVAAYQALRSRRTELERYLRLQPDGWLLVLLDDVPVGLGGLTNYGVFSYLGMMSVHPRAQRRGVGKVLMEHLLRLNKQWECPTILLDATDAGARLYQPFGFREIAKTAQWRLSRDILPVPRHEAQPLSISTIQPEDVPALVDFERSDFGVDRRSVLRLMCEEYVERAFVARNQRGEVEGYIYAQNQSVGPWMAHSVEVAEALLRRALALPFTGAELSVNISPENTEGCNLLEHYGFQQQRVLSHMCWGEAVARDLSKIYGQASFALG